MNKSLSLVIVKRFFSSSQEKFIFWTTLAFYFLLWTINPGNKIIAFSFIVLIALFYVKLKDIRVGTLLAYLSSLIVFTGKNYTIQLIPEGVYPKDWFPHGYIVFFTITPALVIASIITLLLIRDFIVGRANFHNFKVYDLALFAYFFWIVSSDIFSNRPEVSLLFSLSGVQILVFYTYLKAYIKDKGNFIGLLISLIAAQVIFESYIAFRQLMIGSPLFKNLEVQLGIEFFGSVADELAFRFRPVGTFNHANLLGMWMSFWLSAIFVSLYQKRNLFFFSTFVLGLATLIVTLSRSAWLGFAAALIFSLFVLDKIKKIKPPELIIKNTKGLIAIFSILFIFFIFPRAERSIYTLTEGGGYFRYLQLQETLPVILKNPLFGVGSAMLVPEVLNYNPKGLISQISQRPLAIHNWYLLLVAEHGIPALIFFTTFLVLVLRENLYLIWREKMTRLLGLARLGFMGGVFALLIVGVFQPFIGETLIIMAFAILGGAYAKNRS